MLAENVTEWTKEWLEEDREEGREKNLTAIVKKMRIDGFGIDVIQQVTGLSREEIEATKKL